MRLLQASCSRFLRNPLGSFVRGMFKEKYIMQSCCFYSLSEPWIPPGDSVDESCILFLPHLQAHSPSELVLPRQVSTKYEHKCPVYNTRINFILISKPLPTFYPCRNWYL